MLFRKKDKSRQKGISFKTAAVVVLFVHVVVFLFILIPPPKPKAVSSDVASNKQSEEKSNSNQNKQSASKNESASSLKEVNKPKVAKAPNPPTPVVATVKQKPKKDIIPHKPIKTQSVTDEQDNLRKLTWKQLKSTPSSVKPSPVASEVSRKSDVKPENYITQPSGYVSVPVVNRSNVDISDGRYILKPGDNLYAVSRKLNVSFNDLIKYNNIRDVRDLYAGQVLDIPTYENY